MKIKKLLLVLLSLFIVVFFTSCPNKIEEEILETNYNPSVDVLKESNIPIVKIDVNNKQSIDSKTEWKDARMEIFGDFCGYEDLIIDEFKIKGRGNSSWSLPKKPYSIKLNSKSKILGMKKSKRWVLIANYSDKSLLRNYFASYLGNNLYDTVWNPSFKCVHVILNDEYRGVYLLGEQIKIDENRVNISDISESETNDGGFIFEINQRLDENFNFITTHQVYISLKDPDEFTEECWGVIKNIIQNAENVLFEGNDYQNYFDVDSVIDWYIMNELCKNVDSANFSSIYFYYDSLDGKLHMGPNWDFDISCGNVNWGSCDNPKGELYVKNNSVWIKKMFEDSDFRLKVKNRWNEKKDSLYSVINEWILSQANTLSKSADHNFQKWTILGKCVWANCEGFENRKTYSDEVNFLVNWLNQRYEYLDEEFNKM